MKYLIIFLAIIILLPLISAETTFFDNPNDFFVMGNPSTGGVIIEESTRETTSGGGCSYKWNCTNWNKCLPSGMQVRNCVNIGTCLDTYKIPETKQDCTYIPSLEDGKEKINGKEIAINKILIYFIIILVVLSTIIYLKKDYFKKLIKKRKTQTL